MKYIHLKEVSSTNDYLKAHYEELENWTILTCDKQTNGRGRLDHKWESSPKENLICSILIKDKKVLNNHSCLVLLTGTTVYRLLLKLGLNDVKIKLPNDIYARGRKICGILLESISLGDELKALIIGVGLNLNQTTFSKDLNAISYTNIMHKNIDIITVLNEFITLLKEDLNSINSIDYNNRLLEKYHKVIIPK